MMLHINMMWSYLERSVCRKTMRFHKTYINYDHFGLNSP